MARRNADDVIGYCWYCKDEIYAHHNFVTVNNKRFHLDCFKLVEEEETGTEE